MSYIKTVFLLLSTLPHFFYGLDTEVYIPKDKYTIGDITQRLCSAETMLIDSLSAPGAGR